MQSSRFVEDVDVCLWDSLAPLDRRAIFAGAERHALHGLEAFCWTSLRGRRA